MDKEPQLIPGVGNNDFRMATLQLQLVSAEKNAQRFRMEINEMMRVTEWILKNMTIDKSIFYGPGKEEALGVIIQTARKAMAVQEAK